MLFAKVVLGLPVEGPFDYIVPGNLAEKIKVGERVGASFRNLDTLGYVVRLTRKSNIKNLKVIQELIDDSPILDKNMLSLTKELSDYYCCSWGEAIETALPESLRKRKKISALPEEAPIVKEKYNPEVILLHDLDGKARWDVYLNNIKETLNKQRSVMVLLPDVNSLLKAKEEIERYLGIQVALLYRKQPKELEEWLKIKEGKVNIVVGTRSSIFAPLKNLGLVIIDEEQDFVYKQDQVPHYHARVAAFIRTNIEKAKLILGSAAPSLETFYLTKKNKIRYISLPRKREFPEIKIIDFIHSFKKNKQQNSFLSEYLADSIISTLGKNGKTLLFLNRRGFATSATCGYCGVVLKCPRCNINLVYHFKVNLLECHYCNFKMQPPVICPNCDRGYIKYSGAGTEKIESELSRLFPQARIKKLDKNQQQIDLNNADIFVSSRHIIRETDYSFDLVGVLSIDNSLDRVDLRAGEKTFGLLVGLLGLTKGKMVIQTRLSYHHCFKALENKNINIFYEEELRQRGELRFPPYSHLGLIKLRGQKEAKVNEISNTLFNKLNRDNKNRSIAIMSVNPTEPLKLRGNFYWQILIKSDSAKGISKFLKMHLKKFSHSGVIVTVDIDPI
jgi:primosomal protein N' (replication factor Y)